jgi:hypothetical protein
LSNRPWLKRLGSAALLCGAVPLLAEGGLRLGGFLDPEEAELVFMAHPGRGIYREIARGVAAILAR